MSSACVSAYHCLNHNIEKGFPRLYDRSDALDRSALDEHLAAREEEFVDKIAKQFKIIDTDTHVIEPYDLWTSRISTQKYGDLVPHVKWDQEKEEDAWYFGDKRTGAAAASAMAGWHEYPPNHPRRLGDVNPATWRGE